MAFPTVAGFGGSNTGANVTTTTVALQTLTGAAAVGDLHLVTITKDGTSVFTWPAGWAVLFAGELPSASGYLESRWRIVASGDVTSFDITHSSEGTAHQVYRITAGTFFTPPSAGSATGTDTAPDPPSLDPQRTLDHLWLAFTANNNGTVSTSSGPTNYTNFQNDVWNDVNGNGIASARRSLRGGSENPGTFALSGSTQWAALTVNISPISDGTGFPEMAGLNGSNSGGNVTTSTVDIVALVGPPTTGDLLIITITKDGTGAFTWPASPAFTQCSNYPLAVGGTAGAIHDARYRISTGNETTVAITHASESTAWEVIRIAAGTWGGPASANTAPASATVAGDSTNADPPNLDPATWGTENTLWIATAGWDGQPANSAGPASYILFRTDLVAAAGGARAAIAVRENAVSAENPGAFTSDAEQWAAGTIAIMPNTARSCCQSVVNVMQAVNRSFTY